MSLFGWSYPAGVSGTPYDEPSLCEICGVDCDACQCPECSECGEIGDPDCYQNHGMVLTPGQIPLTGPVAVVDVDTAQYIGNEKDGVYFTVAQGPAGGWYVTTMVDTDWFAETYVQDDGPYDSEEAAARAGRDSALEWCGNNDVHDVVIDQLAKEYELLQARVRLLERLLLAQFPGADLDLLVRTLAKELKQ